VEERETMFCFLDFQQMSEDPKITQKPVMDFRVSGHLAQSESAKPYSLREIAAEKKTPLAGADLRYLNILVAAW
jgi:hypothetical protein